MSNKQASMTAAPVNMVAIKMSWPGQSTKLTWRCKTMGDLHLSQLNKSSLSEEKLL